MKGRSLSILGIIAAAVGVVFILACNTIDMHTLAIIVGAIFVASGLIDLTVFGVSPDKDNRASMSFLSCVTSIVFGITMLVYADDFVHIMPFMLSMLIGASAVWQFVTLALAARPYQLPAWLYLFPLVLVGGAIYLFIIKDSQDNRLLMLSSGIAIAVIGAGCIIEGSVLGVARRRHNKEAALAEAEANTETEQSDTADDAQPTTKKEKTKRPVETTDDLDDEVK